MFQGGTGLGRIVPSIALGLLLATAGWSVPRVWAAPGDPLGGDDTGCAPTTKLGLSCGLKTHASLAKLKRAVIVCHLTQAGHAFQNGMGTPGFSNAEDNCETGPSAQSAKAKFDARMAKLALACDPTVIANVNARGATLLADQGTAGSMDDLNATFFCDATSGNPIDPGGDDGGFIPASADNYKCSVTVAKLWSKLDYTVAKCHQKLVKAVFAGKPFDEEACEDTGVKSALESYNAKVSGYIAAGICPPCLADSMAPTNALALGASTVADADAQLQEPYICPGP
jgi:hypothetical protein